jgi:hypothetical protein
MATKITSVQLGRKPTLSDHQGDACAREGVLAGHIVGKNPGKVMASWHKLTSTPELPRRVQR